MQHNTNTIVCTLPGCQPCLYKHTIKWNPAAYRTNKSRLEPFENTRVPLPMLAFSANSKKKTFFFFFFLTQIFKFIECHVLRKKVTLTPLTRFSLSLCSFFFFLKLQRGVCTLCLSLFLSLCGLYLATISNFTASSLKMLSQSCLLLWSSLFLSPFCAFLELSLFFNFS